MAGLGIYAFLFIALYFEIFSLVTLLEKRPRGRNLSLKLSRSKTVSVIVPCFNEEKTIARTLRSLLALSYPKEKLSVVVVDDGSTDGTSAIAKRFEKYPQVKVLRKENGGKFTALNFGIARSKSELVGCLDADSFVDPRALSEIVHHFNEDETVMAVTPAVKVFRPTGLLELIQHAEYSLGIFQKKVFDNLGAIPVLPGPFSIYKREVFEKIGGFRHAYNTEDLEMTIRMHANHMKMANAHTAHVYTKVPNTFWALVKQRVRWVQGFIQNSIDYRYMYFNRKYGALGLFVLPTGALAIITALYFVGYSLVYLANQVIAKIVEVGVVGVAGSFHAAREWSWFYLDTSAALFVIMIILPLTLFLVMYGKRLAEDKVLTLDNFYYLFLYGFLAPVWLAKAVFNAVTSRKNVWR